MKKTWFDNPMWPKCFDSPEQLEGWRQAMLQSKNTSYSIWVCIDCTPTYQKKMIKEKRCENKHVKFKKENEQKANGEIKDREWSIIGFVSETAYKKELNKRKLKQAKLINSLYKREQGEKSDESKTQSS